jgi:peptidoglycan/LPS O-acetylase OafA/YrhL
MNRRLDELDSLRGLAALTVLFGHFSLVFNQIFIGQDVTTLHYIYKYTPVHMIWSGHEAVMLFFVLSGFVLTLPFLKGGEFSYLNYLIKRFFRIYLPTIVSVLIALILVLFFVEENTSSINSDWIAGMWNKSPSIGNFFEHLTLLTRFNPQLNPVLWSLVHEMRISIIFPFIVWIVFKYDWKKVILLGFVLSVFGVVTEKFLGLSLVPTNYFISFHYAFMFLAGSLLAKYHQGISNKVSLVNKGSKILLLVVAILLYTFRWLLSSNEIIHNKLSNEWATTIGVCIIIILALSSKTISKVLKIKPMKFLGKISFSFYLYHLVILLLLTKTFGNLPILLIFLLTFVLTLIASTTSYYLVERPSIKLGKALSKKRVQLENQKSQAS